MRYAKSLSGTLLALGSLLASAAPCAAMVVAKRGFPELVAGAEQIVVGTVSAIRVELNAAGTPFTLVTLSDLSVWKGDVGPTLTLRFYGGTVGDVTVQIPDMPHFVVGERDVVFVAGNGSSVCPLVGVWQGRYYVRFDPAIGTDVVEDSSHQPPAGIAPRALLRAPAASGANDNQATAMTLDTFRQLVADELAHPPSSQ